MFKKLVTFGDSFLAQRAYFKTTEPISWIDYICKENNFRLDGYGDGGTNPYNAILNFLEYNEDFDICFFSWSHIFRVIYNNRRLIDIANGYETAQEQIDIPQQELTDIYYKYVFATDDFEWVKAQAMLEWFDRHLQKNYKDKKFIHFYSLKINDKDFYPHIFKHGINIKPHLAEFSHIGGEDYTPIDPHNVKPSDRRIHMIPKVHKLIANQLNKILKDESLSNGDVVEFSLEH